MKRVGRAALAAASVWMLARVVSAQAVEPNDEENHLATAMSETNGAPTEVVRALEQHLRKFPATAKRNEIERAILKSAMDLGDQARVLAFGEKVLERDPNNLQIIDRVTAALLQSDSEARLLRAIDLGKRFEAIVRKIDTEPVQSDRDAARQRDEVDRGLSRALMNQARALGKLGKTTEAVEAARKAFAAHVSGASARELGMWLAKTGKHEEAAVAYADAVTAPDTRTTDAERLADRKSMGEAWRKSKGSDAGLGEVLLASLDRTAAAVSARERKLRELDANRAVTNPMEFTITGLDGKKLKLASLRGKVVVLDFWATWCGPCRAQYPLYEETKKRFDGADDVVFLAINTDEDHSIVKPFLDENKWAKSVYFEDGLSRQLNVSSIPTTLIFDKEGQLANRMTGFVPDRFVDMLTQRIKDALFQDVKDKRQIPRAGGPLKKGSVPPPPTAKQ